MLGRVKKCFKGDRTYFFHASVASQPSLLEASITAACVPSDVKTPPRSDETAADSSSVDANRGGGGGPAFPATSCFCPSSSSGGFSGQLAAAASSFEHIVEEADCSSGAKPAGKHFSTLHGRYGSPSRQKYQAHHSMSGGGWGGQEIVQLEATGYSTSFFWMSFIISLAFTDSTPPPDVFRSLISGAVRSHKSPQWKKERPFPPEANSTSLLISSCSA